MQRLTMPATEGINCRKNNVKPYRIRCLIMIIPAVIFVFKEFCDLANMGIHNIDKPCVRIQYLLIAYFKMLHFGKFDMNK